MINWKLVHQAEKNFLGVPLTPITNSSSSKITYSVLESLGAAPITLTN